MKKLAVALVLVLGLIPAFALADTDLSSMTFDELVALNSALLSEIMSRDEFKEVTVPAGDYVIGQDIPAGTYSLSLPSGSLASMITVNSIEKFHSLTGSQGVGKIELKDGDDISITAGPIVFAPYIGLGF